MVEAVQHLLGEGHVADFLGALGDALAHVADALEIAGHAQRADDFAQVDRHRLALGNHHEDMLVQFVLQIVEHEVLRDDRLRHRLVAAHERGHGLCHDAFGMAAHFRHLPRNEPEVLVECCNRMICHRAAFRKNSCFGEGRISHSGR